MIFLSFYNYVLYNERTIVWLSASWRENAGCWFLSMPANHKVFPRVSQIDSVAKCTFFLISDDKDWCTERKLFWHFKFMFRAVLQVRALLSSSLHVAVTVGLSKCKFVSLASFHLLSGTFGDCNKSWHAVSELMFHVEIAFMLTLMEIHETFYFLEWVKLLE